MIDFPTPRYTNTRTFDIPEAWKRVSLSGVSAVDSIQQKIVDLIGKKTRDECTDLNLFKLSCNGSLFLYKQVNFVVKFCILSLHCI